MSTMGHMDRFWSKVDKTGECWVWTAACNNRHYGLFGFNGRLVLAHRFAYELTTSPIPEGLVIDHICFNTKCVRPDHLRAVTPTVNTRNRKGHQSNSKTKVRGVFWNSQKQKYQAKVGHKHVGFFADLELAECAVKAARERMYG